MSDTDRNKLKSRVELAGAGAVLCVTTFDDHRIALLDPFVKFAEQCWSDEIE